jgi:hypothetical protein
MFGLLKLSNISVNKAWSFHHIINLCTLLIELFLHAPPFLLSVKEKKMTKAQKRVLASKRKAHFANGGSASTWCGKSNAHPDRKKEKSRSACRKKIREE